MYKFIIVSIIALITSSCSTTLELKPRDGVSNACLSMVDLKSRVNVSFEEKLLKTDEDPGYVIATYICGKIDTHKSNKLKLSNFDISCSYTEQEDSFLAHVSYIYDWNKQSAPPVGHIPEEPRLSESTEKHHFPEIKIHTRSESVSIRSDKYENCNLAVESIFNKLGSSVELQVNHDYEIEQGYLVTYLDGVENVKLLRKKEQEERKLEAERKRVEELAREKHKLDSALARAQTEPPRKIDINTLFGKATKTEFENTSDYKERRMKQVPEEIIFSKGISLKNNKPRYDADSENLSISIPWIFEGAERTFLGPFESFDIPVVKGAELKSAWEITIKEKEVHIGSYAGQNSYGANARVEVSEEESWNFLIQNPQFSHLTRSLESEIDDSYAFRASFKTKIPREQAKSILQNKNKRFTATVSLAPCRQQDNCYIKTTERLNATLDYPYERSITNHYYLARFNYITIKEELSNKLIALIYSDAYVYFFE